MEITIVENEGFFVDGEHIKELPIEQLHTLAKVAFDKAIRSTTEDNRIELQTVLYYATELLGKEEDGIITWKI